MSATEMFVLYAIAALVFTAVLIPLCYAAVLDGRYNDEQQRRASGQMRQIAREHRVPRSSRPAAVALGAAS